MSCCNARTLSLVIAGLTIAICTLFILLDIVLMALFFFDNNYQRTDEYVSYKDIAVPYFGVVFILCLAGLVTAILFIKGVKKNRPGQMAPFVYLTAAGIIFSGLSAICMYIADLIKQPTVAHALLIFIQNILSLGLDILLFSPIFLVYKRMTKSAVQPEEHALRTNEPVLKSNYSYGDRM